MSPPLAASGCGYRLAHFSGPGTLDPATEDGIVAGLAEALPALKIAEYFQANHRILSQCDHVITAADDASGQPVGVLASRKRVLEDGTIFLHVVMHLIASRYERTLLTKHMWRLHLGKLEAASALPTPLIFALKTCHPSVFTALQAFLRIPGVRLYPCIDGGDQAPKMLALARGIARTLFPSSQLTPGTGVLRNASNPRDFYPELPSCRRENVDAFFLANLSPADRLLCLLVLETVDSRQRLLRAFGVAA